ncbi:MAG: hypothetical protein HKN61_09265 [Flavobacteriaceae bacterium]|nr:hypothetical protein [Flavobacteriaceae bacterium]
MLKLPVSQIIENIEREIPFHAMAEDNSFQVKIDYYAPYLCGAVHDGHQFRHSLSSYCLHSEYERWYEEDPCTLQMVADHPMVIAGCDSRFEYDLNRPPELAIYKDAWGKLLWKNPLPENEIKISQGKHKAFYEVTRALVAKMEERYGKALVFDMHSYNWKRWQREVPTWNLGTANIDNERFGSIAESWCKLLGQMELPGTLRSTSRINDTFQGNGYFLKFITNNFDHTLVLATEIAKIYCDELNGEIYPEVVQAVSGQLKEFIPLQHRIFEETVL